MTRFRPYFLKSGKSAMRAIAVVQLAAVEATQRMGMQAGLVIAAFVIVPQIVAAWLAPAIGRFADLWGRRTVLLAGFATVPIRNALFAVIRHPVGLIPVQALEGAGGAVFGIMMPLVAADLPVDPEPRRHPGHRDQHVDGRLARRSSGATRDLLDSCRDRPACADHPGDGHAGDGEAEAASPAAAGKRIARDSCAHDVSVTPEMF